MCPDATFSSRRETFQVVQDESNCTEVIHRFNPLIHKPKYIVGVFNRGEEESTFRSYNTTFAQYLTATAGRKFDPPIEFSIISVEFTQLMELAEEKEVDFTFATSVVSTCMATQFEAQPLVTSIRRRECRGSEYDLDVYGGVMFTLGKSNVFMAFREMLQHATSHSLLDC